MGTGPTLPPKMPPAPEKGWSIPSPITPQQPLVTKQTTIIGYLAKAVQLPCNSMVKVTAPNQDPDVTPPVQPLEEVPNQDQETSPGYEVGRLDTSEVTKEPELDTTKKNQNSEQSNLQTPTPPINKNINENGESNCEFKRGGFCKVHNVQGSKYWIPTKTWKKKTNGSFGYVNGRKVGYKCSSTQFLPPSSTIEKAFPDGVVSNTVIQRVPSTLPAINLDKGAPQIEK